jgi:hypothetical protein
MIAGLVLIAAGAAPVAAGANETSADASAPRHQTGNGMVRGPAEDEMRAMLLKYTARCALRDGQFLEDSEGTEGQPARRYPGSLGLAPEWLDGTCGDDCQERVSSCLIALTNRTGKHVALSLLSNASGMSEGMRPSAQDLPFPHQEGAFFGNMFTGQAFACHGRDVAKARQVKRFCAAEPASCSGLAQFRDAGSCDDACEMSCQTLSDGSQRCAAVSCRDPEGRTWRSPITTYLRNQIEAGNADSFTGTAQPKGEALERLDRGARARFEQVDFGATPGATSQLVLTMETRSPGQIEAWLDGRERLGVMKVAAGANAHAKAGKAHEQVMPLRTHQLAGRHALELRIVAGHDIGRVATIELR